MCIQIKRLEDMISLSRWQTRLGGPMWKDVGKTKYIA
jgi:hypothetical protein